MARLAKAVSLRWRRAALVSRIYRPFNKVEVFLALPAFR
jgi:hypothetical protein